MFKTRLISGVILVIIALLTLGAGGLVLYFTSLALSLIAAGEFFLCTKVRDKTIFGAMDIAGYVSIVIYYLAILFAPKTLWMMFIVIGFMIPAFVFVFAYPRYNANQFIATFFGVVYTGVMFSCVYLTRCMETGKILVWLIMLASWGSDTCAYCVGMLFGKHKMAPILSPKKSVEGGIGGIAGAAILGIIFGLITKGPFLSYALICAVGAVISMVGDLTASGIKRSMEIKDYGKLIPGHGGILDRFDSVIFTAPVIFFMASLLIH